MNPIEAARQAMLEFFDYLDSILPDKEAEDVREKELEEFIEKMNQASHGFDESRAPF